MTDFPTFDSPVALRDAVTNFAIANGSKLPEDAQARLADAINQTSTVVGNIAALETLYAQARDNPAAQVMMGSLANWASADNMFGYGERGTGPTARRGFLIEKAMQRDLGQDAPAAGWPDPKDDPAPLDEYMAPTPDTEKA